MIINAPNLNLFFTAMDTRYSQAFELAQSWADKIATPYPCGTENWQQGWIGMLDRMREWVGPRVVRTPAPQAYVVPIKPFELTIGIDKFKLEDDTHGIYFPIASHIGQQMKKWPDYQLRDLFQASGSYSGLAQIGADEVTHWNNAHPVDFYDAAKGTYCNDYGTAGVVVNGVTVGGAFSANAWSTMWVDMTTRKNEANETWGIVPDLTMLPAQLNFPGKTIIQASFFSPPQLGALGAGSGANGPFVGAMENPLKGATDLFCNPDIANESDTYYMFAANGWVIKPFGWVLRKAPVMIPRVDPTDPVVFELHQFQWGAEARGVPALGLPAFSSRSGKDS